MIAEWKNVTDDVVLYSSQCCAILLLKYRCIKGENLIFGLP